MRIAVCPGCGHQNRSAIVATICDRCGEDISTVAEPEPSLRRMEDLEEYVAARPAEAQEPEPEPGPEAQPEPEPKPRRLRVWSLVVRLLLCGAAVAVGVHLSLRAPLGSALAGDPLLAGSVAILAAAAAVSGALMLLVPAGGKRSAGVTTGMRAMGVLMALVGVWAFSTISVWGTHPPATTSPMPVYEDMSPMMDPGGMGPMGPGMPGGGPGGGLEPGMPGEEPGPPGPAPPAEDADEPPEGGGGP